VTEPVAPFVFRVNLISLVISWFLPALPFEKQTQEANFLRPFFAYRI